MQDSDSISHGSFFLKKGSHRPDREFDFFSNPVVSPYFLESIDKIDSVFFAKGKYLMEGSCQTLESMMNIKGSCSDLTGYSFLNGNEYFTMMRLSECKYMLAVVYETCICIEKPGEFFTLPSNFKIVQGMQGISIMNLKEIHKDADFKLSDGKYNYLEWPSVNKYFVEKPYFLTLDNQGKLRIHHVQEKVQEVLNSEDIYTSATFSLDGRYIYAINKDQEICIINFHRELENKIVLKRVIPGLDAKTMISTHILQIPSNMLIIGSIERTIEDLNEITKLYLHVICGDISDHNSELKIKEFNVSKLESLDHKHPIIFRSFYVKERQLLLFGNTASDKVQTFYFGFDGSIKEIDVLDLEGATLRGITYQREIIKNKRQKPKLTVEYQNKKFRIPKPPSVLIWDSKGSMHHFHYCDTRYAVQAFSSTIQLSVPEFNLQEELIKKKLNRKRRSRCKSSNPRRIKEVIKEKRGCSLTREGVLKSQSNLESFKLELKKMKEVMPLKNITNGLLSNSKTLTENCIENKKQNTEVNKNSISTSKSSLFLPNKEKIAPSQTSTSLWSSNNNKAEGPSTSKSNLFSASTSSLFSSASTSSSRSSLFQTTKVKETKTSQNGLFSLEKQPDSQESFKTPNLFPETLKSESFLQAFQMAPIVKDKKSKRAALFLNKFESDVVFKVENEEFYAHKSILSENCTFFKRMFASGMLESSSSVIEIHDTKAPVFRAFLEYLYVYKTELNEDLVLDVLDFADKYVVKDLKNYCENYFIRILASENCFKFFEIACLYNATYLKERLLYHFKKELKEIIEKKDIYNLPINSYRYILDMHWKDKVILGPPFSKLIE